MPLNVKHFLPSLCCPASTPFKVGSMGRHLFVDQLSYHPAITIASFNPSEKLESRMWRHLSSGFLQLLPLLNFIPAILSPVHRILFFQLLLAIYLEFQSHVPSSPCFSSFLQS
ncbi:unnamed protein product [Cuscuta epithymum]|uniref:Uncharacterized protein n=1 Tax=Cuscuta epithymum TaxID=186058 RepID=A0AAV0G1N9_9ASTE|nr:unnamed protein product [Cuscuta epithymum]